MIEINADENQAGWIREVETEYEPDAEEKAEGGSWVPYKGPKGGEGWQNTESGEKVYDDEPPGEVDLSSLEEYELVNLAFERFDLSEGDTRDLIDEVDSRDDFEDVVRDRIVPDGAAAPGPSDSGSAIGAKALSEGDEVLIDDEPAEVTTKKEMGPGGYFIAGETREGEKVTARVSRDADFEEVVTSTAGPVAAGSVSEGDKIVIDGERVEVERASDMGGGFYIAGRGDDGEVHTARVGPDAEFDSWAEGGEGGDDAPDHDVEEGDRLLVPSGTGDTAEVRVAGVDAQACGPGEIEVEDAKGNAYCRMPEDLEEHPDGRYETTGGFDEELAAAVRSEDPMGTSDIYRNMGKVDDPWLVADALEQELDGPNRKTARERLASKLGTFNEGPTEEEVRARLRDGPVDDPPDPPGDDYPSDVYDSAEEELEALGANSNTATGATDRFGRRGRGGYDLDKIRRLNEHADTETLEQIAQDEWSTYQERPVSDKGQMAAGLLHYREDSDFTWEDAMNADLHDPSVPADEDEIRQNANESFDMLDPAVGALTMTHIETFKAGSGGPGDNWLGVWKSGSQQLIVKDDMHYGRSTTKHEIGHAVQYALGVTGKSSRDNTEGRGSHEPTTWDFNVDLAKQPPESAEDMADELEDEIERFKDRAADQEKWKAECRQYQRTNTNEFIAVTFQHWQNDRAKLESKHPEMADFWDRHAGGGVEGKAESDVSNHPGNEVIEDATEGDRVDLELDGALPDWPHDEVSNAEVLDNHGSIVRLEAGPEKFDVPADAIERAEVRGGSGPDTDGEPDDSYNASDVRVSDPDALERELSGRTLAAEYESYGETERIEDMEIQEVTDQTVWLRDPTETGPGSEMNIPIDQLEWLEAYDQ